MKIRSYTGPELEPLYARIQEELGPEAVVVHAQGEPGRRLIGGRSYRLLAIVSDGDAEAHAASGLASVSELRRLHGASEKRLSSMARQLESLREELRGIGAARPMQGGPCGMAGVPAASEWVPRFTESVRRALALPAAVVPSAELVQRAVAGVLNVCEDFPMQRPDGKPHTIVLVGPTGSGKTTTLAKMAAIACLERGLRVGLVTADTYRVAATDQLREYASLLGMELRVVFSAGEAAQTAAAFADRDVILVDTPGRNHHDGTCLRDMRSLLEPMGPATTLLLLPAVYGKGTMRDMLANYRVYRPDYLVVTKVDEAHSGGAVTVAAAETETPFAFLTDGQRVPEDIRVARRSDVARWLVLGREGLACCGANRAAAAQREEVFA
jgi:flagellar biosynthesis GTPase FlhF